MKNIKTIGVSLLMVLSVTGFAQEKDYKSKPSKSDRDSKSEIVMTKAELDTFLKTVADARRAQLKANKSNKAKSVKTYRSVNREISNIDLLREIDRVNYRLDYLTGGSGSNYYAPGAGRGSNSTLVVPGGNSGMAYVPGQQPYYLNNGGNANDRTLWELEKKVDSLKALQNGKSVVVQPKSEANEIAGLKQQFADLETRLAQTNDPAQRRGLLEELLAKFKNFKKQVFFANASSTLSASDLSYVNDVAQVLNQYPELSIVLEGWASPRGNTESNKQLSMKRAESVEKALISKGISSDRIVSSFKGEDHSTSESGARRVDMSVILK